MIAHVVLLVVANFLIRGRSQEIEYRQTFIGVKEVYVAEVSGLPNASETTLLYSLHLDSHGQSWNRALAFCLERGAKPVSIHSFIDLEISFSLLSMALADSESHPSAAWLGLIECRDDEWQHTSQFYNFDLTLVPAFVLESIITDVGGGHTNFLGVSYNTRVLDFLLQPWDPAAEPLGYRFWRSNTECGETDDVKTFVSYVQLQANASMPFEHPPTRDLQQWNLSLFMVQPNDKVDAAIVCVSEKSSADLLQTAFIVLTSVLGSVLALSILFDIVAVGACCICTCASPEFGMAGLCRSIQESCQICSEDDPQKRWKRGKSLAQLISSTVFSVCVIIACVIFAAFPGFLFLRAFAFGCLEFASFIFGDCLFLEDCCLDYCRNCCCQGDGNWKSENTEESQVEIDVVHSVMTLSSGIENVAGLIGTILLIFAPIDGTGVLIIVAVAQVSQWDNFIFDFLHSAIDEAENSPFKIKCCDLSPDARRRLRICHGVVTLLGIVVFFIACVVWMGLVIARFVKYPNAAGPPGDSLSGEAAYDPLLPFLNCVLLAVPALANLLSNFVNIVTGVVPSLGCRFVSCLVFLIPTFAMTLFPAAWGTLRLLGSVASSVSMIDLPVSLIEFAMMYTVLVVQGLASVGLLLWGLLVGCLSIFVPHIRNDVIRIFYSDEKVPFLGSVEMKEEGEKRMT